MAKYSVIHKPEITVMGLICKTSNEKGPGDIHRHWSRFYSKDAVKIIPYKASNELIALYCDYEKDDTASYSFLIGCPVKKVEEVPEGLVVRKIPEGNYAYFRSVGEQPKELLDLWSEIMQMGLKRKFIAEYEVYGDRFFGRRPQEIDVMIGIEAVS